MTETTTIPDDPALLKPLVLELADQLKKSRRREELLQAKLEELARKLFGRKSEKFDPNQLCLIDLDAFGIKVPEAEPESEAEAQEPPDEPCRRPKRKPLIGTCRYRGWDPYEPLRWLYTCLPGLPESRLHEMTPLAWAAEKGLKSSLLKS